MCGIAGYVNKIKKQDAIKTTIDILKSLEYRGYDSSGIVFLDDKNKYSIEKAIGKIKNLNNKINFNNKAKLAIAHTRWATHGKISLDNCHPHTSKNVILVHNGIIENYLELKSKLEKAKQKFYSQTDTEVICKLIDFYYDKTKNHLKAISQALKELKGSYALAIVFKDDDKIYAVAKNSPLVISDTKNGIYLSSDVKSLPKNDKFYFINDKTIAVLNEDKLSFYDMNQKNIKVNPTKLDNTNITVSKEGYETFMLKEISEQPMLIHQTIERFWKKNKLDFGFKPEFIKFLKQFNYVRVIGCGTAYNSGLLIQSIIQTHLKIKSDVVIASEFRYEPFIKIDKTLNIIISQSGETADTIHAMRLVKKYKEKTLSLTNNNLSVIANEADINIDMKCGPEYAVASSKAYTIQTVTFHMLTLYISQLRKMVDQKYIDKKIKDLKLIDAESKKVFNDLSKIKNLAKRLTKADPIFFLGKGINFALACEASLKFKEITYLNSNAYPSGELKHGNISLINDKAYVIGIFATDDEIINEKMVSGLKETRSRGSKNIYIGNDSLLKHLEENEELLSIGIKYNDFSYIPIIFICQLIAYYAAKELKNDIDCPKNLAKSVTVE